MARARIDGLRELGQALRGLKKEMAQKIAWRMTGRAAAIVKKAARQNVISSPAVETGSLRDAIVTKRVPRGQLRYTAEHWVTVRRRKTGKKTKGKQPTAPHAGFVEFGTVKMPKEAYLGPALSRNVQRIGEEMRKAGQKGIAKANK